MKRTPVLALAVLALFGCTEQSSHSAQETAAEITADDVRAQFGPCALAQGGFQPRLGFAVHNLQPRESSLPNAVASLGFVTTCMIDAVDASMQATFSLPFLAGSIETGTYEVKSAGQISTDIEKDWAFASLVVHARSVDIEYQSRGGELRIVEASDTLVRGAYRITLGMDSEIAELPSTLEIDGTFASKPNRNDPYTMYALGEMNREDLTRALYLQGQITKHAFDQAMANLEAAQGS